MIDKMIKILKKKKNLLIVIAVAILMIVIFDVKNRRDISNIISGMDYGYEDYCSEEFLDAINSKVYTVFDSFSKKRKLVSMMNDNSCYKHNGITSSVYFYTPDTNGIHLKKEDGYINAQVVFIDSEGNQIVDYEAKIKVRGNSTATLAKKPFNIKFSEKIDLLGFGKAKKWNLLAECADPTMIRNRTFLNLGHELGLENTSNSEYVELYIDGTFWGGYLLTEAVEAGEDRVDIDVDEGEFLIEYEHDRVEKDATYIVTEHGIRFVLSEPDEPDNNQLEYITNVMNEFDKCLFSDDYKQVEKLLDIDSFIKVYLINEYAKTVDFGYSSVNLYYKDNKFYAGPIWDFDLSSGNFDEEKEPQKGYWVIEDGEKISYSEFFCRIYNPIYNKLLSYPEIEEKYKNLFNENYDLLKSIYEENGFLDQTLDTYGWLFEKNYKSADDGGAGWYVNGKYINIEKTPFDTYQENYDYLKKWLENRLNWLKENS